jgi:hypothetical protein
LQHSDPEGSFLTQTQASQCILQREQFQRCYIAFSFAKHAWNIGSTHVVASNGTMTTSPVFNHTLLLAVIHDGKKQPFYWPMLFATLRMRHIGHGLENKLQRTFRRPWLLLLNMTRVFKVVHSKVLLETWEPHDCQCTWG